MKSQSVYLAMPVPVQNALVSAYGYYQRSKRYGGAYSRIYDEVQAHKRLSAAAVEQAQRAALAQMIEHCKAHVPFYRDSFRGFEARSGQALAELLAAIPVLRKETVRARQAEFQSTGQRPYWVNQTSGSTGTPLVVQLSADAYRLTMALLADHEANHGIPRDAVRATFAGRILQAPEDQRYPYWRFNKADRQTLFSTLHLGEQNLAAYVEHLERVRPHEIIGYPSAIYTVAEYMLRKNVRLGFEPKAVVTNSETVFDWQRDVIERAFRCKVADYYGVAEAVVFAAQCPAGRYHFNPLIGIAEVLDDEGRPVPPGVSGALVCTTLRNAAMPLLRYAVGDDAILAEGPCACGSHYQAATTIVGRTDDSVLTPSGHHVGRLDHIFKGAEGVRECQIVQHELDRFTLRVVPGDAFDEESRAVLAANLRARVGAGVRVEFEVVPAIERTKSGKFKGVISHVRDRSR